MNRKIKMMTIKNKMLIKMRHLIYKIKSQNNRWNMTWVMSIQRMQLTAMIRSKKKIRTKINLVKNQKTHKHDLRECVKDFAPVSMTQNINDNKNAKVSFFFCSHPATLQLFRSLHFMKFLSNRDCRKRKIKRRRKSMMKIYTKNTKTTNQRQKITFKCFKNKS